MKATLDKEAIKIAYATADDGTRPVLECVLIGNKEIVAADGFILARRAISTEPEEGEAILVEAKALLKAHSILEGDELIIESQEDGKSATIKSNNDKVGSLVINISTQLLNAKFPAYKEVIPKSERKAYVALQASILAKVLKTIGADSGRAIKFKIREPSNPVEIHNGETDVYVMPYFVPEEG